VITLKRSGIREVSGIAMSAINKGILYIHEDNGHKGFIHLTDSTGDYRGKLILHKVRNKDWEDISVAPGPDKRSSYIYIADIGDNKAKREQVVIYRFKEARLDGREKRHRIKNTDALHFTYPDKGHNSEAMLVDPITRDIYLVSKQGENAILFRAPYPQSSKQSAKLIKVAILPYTMVTAGDISPDGSEILLRNEDHIWYFRRPKDQSIAQALLSKPLELPFQAEDQGEGICFTRDRGGYYSATESRGKELTVFSFYERK
jgi:hypothetical protein